MARALLLLMLLPAVRTDIAARRIPNRLVATSLLTSFIVSCMGWYQAGFQSPSLPVEQWLAGLAVGLACFMPLYLLGAMGAGDVKLMAACGACMGPQLAWQAAMGALVLGGGMALVWKARQGLPVVLMWLPLRRLRTPAPQPNPLATEAAVATPPPDTPTTAPLRRTAARLPFSLPILAASFAATLL